ncbi:MAG TPA: rhodanese-like domain-containing protein [Pyrinomonadaceae bacterium]
MSENNVQIITFYEFKRLENLPQIQTRLKAAMRGQSILGTIVLAEEGFNSTVSGAPENIGKFVREAEAIFETKLKYKSSFHPASPFRRVHVKIKPEIVTLKRPVEIEKGRGTHVSPEKWNEVIKSDDVFVLDTRNDYEFEIGTFRGAVNPKTEKFSDLPRFVEQRLDPAKHKKIAMFCTGGIRCEKFAPYLKGIGFENVYQLEGGILKYLEEIPDAESLWQGECFVFDDRVSVDENLRKGSAEDVSVKLKSEKR